MKEFKKYYIINTDPEQLYLALTTATTIHLWTGDLVEIDPVAGGEFSLWDGAITGKFLEMEPNSKIVQQWYFGEQEVDSIVTMKLHEHKKGTSLEIKHTNIPDEAYDDIVEGWNDTYIASLVEFYEDEE
ncbi:SRPBCC domain-containing protein [Sphingobacterium lactis]|uniref:SRPBCC domain-containing protein n=1 Tax=Sphingobacterium lactis TaxID=797291 RepID=UPI003EC73023